jgi:hypothetical protein
MTGYFPEYRVFLSIEVSPKRPFCGTAFNAIINQLLKYAFGHIAYLGSMDHRNTSAESAIFTEI